MEEKEPERMTCIKCGRDRPTTKDFFKHRDGHREPICKDCLTMFIDNKDRTTFEWILEKFDIPYVEQEWIKIYNRVMKDKGRVSSSGVLGKYMRNMQMQQWRNYTYADTERLNFDNERNKQEIAARLALQNVDAQEKIMELQEQLDAGEISQAQFDTLNPLNTLQDEVEDFLEYAPDDTSAEEEVMNELEEEEVQYLKHKWGATYKPSQWIAMEDTYVQYENEFELNTDRITILKQICKVQLEMDECLAVKDYKSYRDLCGQFDTLRKSGKFTEAQNKEGNEKYLDTIGELVKFCEQEKGLIEMLPNPDDYPQDKIDFTIKDIKNYIQSLVKGELGLGNLIESYIKKLEEAEAAKNSDLTLEIPDEYDEEDYITQEEAEEWHMHIENEIEEEAAMLQEMMLGSDE